VDRLNQEMKVIPRMAWAIAVVLTVGFAFGLVAYHFAILYDGSGFPLASVTPWELVFFSIVLAIFFIYILLLGYIAGDASRRGMRAVLWVLLAMFIPSAIGILLYFILREPLLRPCPRCGTGAKSSFPYCPSCGASLADTCPSCKNAVEPGWSHCARCGTPLLLASTPKG
jgi:hypothetical protein